MILVTIFGRFRGEAFGFAKFGGNAFVPLAIDSTATVLAAVIFAVVSGPVPAEGIGWQPGSATKAPFQAGFYIVQILFNRNSKFLAATLQPPNLV
ncbi:hypothetical protein QUA54_18690 [Microcoleus sp. MOSTC5]|uniref:hypothetical protein n=1 Tax=Microcoleus sp. MOSTC5 TaxID=3055378 RepID=UPI002FD013AD